MKARAFLRAIRVHQWVKNLLLFVPLIMAHRWDNTQALIHVGIGFLAFSLCASGVYIINDLLDIEADRSHPTKRNRPFAAGELTAKFGIVCAPLLVALAALLALGLPDRFITVLIGYFLITTLYSVWFKQIVLVDIITLAVLYSVRIMAGSVAADVVVSQWLIAFSMFLFFSLACMKRYSELRVVRLSQSDRAKGRGYIAHDLEMVAQFGSSSGYLSILVLALYVSSDEVRALYTTPMLLWAVCPAFFYWVSRVWLLAGRGEMHDDPIIFALKDRTSYLVGAFIMVCLFLSL